MGCGELAIIARLPALSMREKIGETRAESSFVVIRRLVNKIRLHTFQHLQPHSMEFDAVYIQSPFCINIYIQLRFTFTVTKAMRRLSSPINAMAKEFVD